MPQKMINNKIVVCIIQHSNKLKQYKLDPMPWQKLSHNKIILKKIAKTQIQNNNNN